MEITTIAMVYNIPERIAERVVFAKTHLDTEEGYRAYYDILKAITDENLPDNVLFDLAAEFAWDNRLEDAIECLATLDGRPDLANI